MLYTITAPNAFTGIAWGVTFVQGVAQTADDAFAAKLARKGYEVMPVQLGCDNPAQDDEPLDEGPVLSEAGADAIHGASLAPPKKESICPLCGKTYKTPDGLAKHIASQHPESAPTPGDTAEMPDTIATEQ